MRMQSISHMHPLRNHDINTKRVIYCITRFYLSRVLSMAFSEFEQARYTKILNQFIEDFLPPAQSQLVIEGKLLNQSIEISELRQRWDDPTHSLSIPVAKATFIRTQKVWRLYWMRGNRKWEKYDEYEHLEWAFNAIKEDLYGCFWG